MCEAADEEIRAAYENDSIHRILPLRHRDCVPKVELQYRPRLPFVVWPKAPIWL